MTMLIVTRGQKQSKGHRRKGGGTKKGGLRPQLYQRKNFHKTDPTPINFLIFSNTNLSQIDITFFGIFKVRGIDVPGKVFIIGAMPT